MNCFSENFNSSSLKDFDHQKPTEAQFEHKHVVDNKFVNSKYDYLKPVFVVERDHVELGLTNQFQELATVLLYGCENHVYICPQKLRADLSLDIYLDVTAFLDIDLSNMNLNCTKIVPHTMIHLFSNHSNHPYQKMQPSDKLKNNTKHGKDNLVHVMSSFVISSERRFIPVESNIVIPQNYYGIHFRMEADWLVYVIDDHKNNHKQYFNWLAATKNGPVGEAQAVQQLHSILNNTTGAAYILCLINQYKDLVVRHFTDKLLPIVFATGLGKSSPLNKEVEFVLDYFILSMHCLGYKTITGFGNSVYRELNAAADMRQMLNSHHFIGDSGSSFSNMIRRSRDEHNKESSFLPGHC
jgi:hypothetical protein